jgi:ribosomal-protein-alanine N-acetyltransferase
MRIEVRRATAADAVRIGELERASGLEPWPPGAYELEADRPDSAFLVLTDSENEEILAFLLARLITISSHATHTPNSIREGEILNFAVDPLFRRSNLATELFRFLVSVAEPAVAVVHLEVRESNFAARQFYRRQGFSETGLRPRFYRDPNDDAILMTWKRESGPA